MGKEGKGVRGKGKVRASELSPEEGVVPGSEDIPVPVTPALPHDEAPAQGPFIAPIARRHIRESPPLSLAPFERKVAAALGELHRLHPTLTPDRPALIGVSGGRDSVALIHFLATHGWKKLIVCHLNHGLRGRESGQDAVFVRRLAAKLGLKVELRRENVATFSQEQKQSLETAARNVRDAFFHELATSCQTPFVFLAHHAEDNAETVLGNLCRGTGLHGLSGMPLAMTTRSGLIKVRPMLEIRRAELQEYLERNQLTWRDDSSNTSRLHRRNRLRHEALPLLAEAAGRDVVEIIVRAARLAAQDEAFLGECVARFAEEQGLWQADGRLLLTRDLQEGHPALQSRVLRYWLGQVHQVKSLGVHEIEGARAMLVPGGPAKMNLPGGRFLRRKAKRMWVE